MRRVLVTRRRAFTLIEMLVIIAIFAVLIGMTMPAALRLRESANQANCRNNLKRLSLAVLQYYDAQGSFPPAYLCQVKPDDPLHTAPGWGWAAHLLPYLDQLPLHDRIDFTQPIETDAHQLIRTAVLRPLICPTDRQAGLYQVPGPTGQPLTDGATTSYAACFGSGGFLGERPEAGDGLFFRNSRVRKDEVADGLSYTLALGERAATFTQTPWAGAVNRGTARVTPGAPVLSTLIEEGATQVLAQVFPRDGYHLNSPHSDPFDFYSAHTATVYFAFADGSVRPVDTSTPVATVLKALATRAGGERVSGEDL